MFGAHYFGQGYFAQGNAGGGATDYRVPKLARAIARYLSGVRRTLAWS